MRTMDEQISTWFHTKSPVKPSFVNVTNTRDENHLNWNKLINTDFSIKTRKKLKDYELDEHFSTEPG